MARQRHIRQESVRGGGVGPKATPLAAVLGRQRHRGLPVSRRPPNILFLQTDNQRWDALGCSGNTIIQTPNVDRLAAQGTYFPNAFATTPICAASRASILTGLYRRRHGFTFHEPPLRTEFTDISYPRLLRDAGYYTGMIGKLGIDTDGRLALAGNASTLTRMFDVFHHYHQNSSTEGYWIPQQDGTHRHLTEIIGDRVVEFLRGSPGDRPFCLSVSFNAPHARDGAPRHYYPPAAESRLYEDQVIPRPAPSGPAFFAALPRFLQENESRKRWHTRWDTEANFQRTAKGYWRMISGVDRMVGRFIDELHRLGVADDTIILYTSDHGFLIGERGHSDCWLLYDNSMRVPLVVYDPRADVTQRGVRREQMALNIDLAPTMLELAGLPVPAMMQGRSLLPLLGGEPTAWRDDFFCEHLFTTPEVIIPRCEGVRSQDWKYIRYIDQEPLYEELYHLASDPDEARNLCSARARAGDLERLRARCDALLRVAQGAAS